MRSLPSSASKGIDRIFCSFIKDPVREITKLAHFLKVPENVQLFQDIAERCSFKNLKRVSDETKKNQLVYRKGKPIQ
jgi:hypothetical protein